MRRSFRPFPLLAACAVLAAAASPAAAQKEATIMIVGPDRVAAGAAFDSAAVMEGLARLPAPPEGAYPVFAVVFGQKGTLEDVARVTRSTPPAYADPVIALLRSAARTLPGGDTTGFYVRAEGGGTPRFAAHTPVLGDPRLLNAAEMTTVLSQMAAEEAEREARREEASQVSGSGRPLPSAQGQPPRGRQTLRLELSMRVEPDGTTTGHVLTRRSTSVVVNREVRRLAAQMLRFQPATMDGHPVARWVALPVTVEYR